MNRVVITGMSAITALGDDWQTFKQALMQGENAVEIMPQWRQMDGLNTQVAAPVKHFSKPAHYKRKKVLLNG